MQGGKERVRERREEGGKRKRGREVGEREEREIVMGESSQVELTLSAMLMSSLMLHLYPVKGGYRVKGMLDWQDFQVVLDFSLPYN